MLRKAGSGWVVVHSNPKQRGQRVDATKKPVSKAKALSIHRAIMASKARRAGSPWTRMGRKK